MSISIPEKTGSSSSHKLVRAVGIISIFTLLSRVFGFVRDVVIAHILGAGMGADAFFVALKLPNFLRRLFAEGAFSTAFVPVFSDYLAQGNHEATHRAVKAVFTMLFLVLFALVALGQIFMPAVIFLVAPGFNDDPEKLQLTIELTRWTFPYILFISLVALAGGILNSHRRFALPAATPVLLNISLILAALYLSPLFPHPAQGLALGVFIGGAAQLIIQWPALRQLKLGFSWHWEPRHPAVRRIASLMIPSILGVSVAQVNLLFDLFLASWLPEGSISYLYYADRLVEFPLGLVGIAMATAILPSLSARAAQGDMEGLKTELDAGMRFTLFVNMPAMVGLIVLRDPLVAFLFQRGAFDAEAARLTSQALLAYGLGLLAFSMVKVIAPAFYAMKDTRTPVKIAIIAMVSNMVLNLILMFPLGHVGLALATSLSSFLNVALLWRAFHLKTGFVPKPGLMNMLLSTLVASLAMGIFLFGMIPYLEDPRFHLWQQGLILAGAVVGGGLLFLMVAWLLRVKEMTMVLRMVRKKKILN